MLVWHVVDGRFAHPPYWFNHPPSVPRERPTVILRTVIVSDSGHSSVDRANKCILGKIQSRLDSIRRPSEETRARVPRG